MIRTPDEALSGCPRSQSAEMLACIVRHAEKVQLQRQHVFYFGKNQTTGFCIDWRSQLIGEAFNWRSFYSLDSYTDEESYATEMDKMQNILNAEFKTPIQKIFTASVESISQSDLYLTVKARLFTAPNANLNGCRCTEAFLDQIVANQDKYIGLPLSADVRNLCDGNYKKLGHMYDADTGQFHSTMIGSFYSFQKEQLNEEQTALIGYARVLKRNAKVCAAVCDLFASGNLSFSFEVSCGEYTELQDGTILIDANEKNSWEGEAIVWSPACPDAVALDLVAELAGLEEGDENMTDVMKDENVVVAETNEATEVQITTAEETTETVEASVSEVKDETAATEVTDDNVEEEVNKDEEQTAKCKQNAQTVDTEKEDTTVETDEDETAKCKKECANEQTAEEVVAEPMDAPIMEPPHEPETIMVEETHVEKDVVDAFNCATGESVHDEITHVTTTVTQMVAELQKEIAELRDRVAELESENKIDVIASTEVNTMNPFMDNISNAHKYSLLEKEDKRFDSYSLLQK